MAIEILSNGNRGNEYVVECPICKSKIRYLGIDIKYHRRYPDGFIYCPRCRSPIAHNEKNLSTEPGSINENPNSFIEKLKREKEEVEKSKNTLSIPGILFFVLSVILFVSGFVCLFTIGDIAYIALVVFGGVCVGASIAFLVVFGTIYENKINRIDQQLSLFIKHNDDEQ